MKQKKNFNYSFIYCFIASAYNTWKRYYFLRSRRLLITKSCFRNITEKQEKKYMYFFKGLSRFLVFE